MLAALHELPRSEATALLALGAAEDARCLFDRRHKYYALQRASVIRGGTGYLRQLVHDNDSAVGAIAAGWAADARGSPATHARQHEVLGAYNGTTHSYQQALEGQAAELVERGDFMLGGKVLDQCEADMFRFNAKLAAHAASGAYSAVDAKPNRAAMREAVARNRDAWRGRLDSGRRPSQSSLLQVGLASALTREATVAASQYVHAQRVRGAAVSARR
ncbi:hypothetical protein T492DRAFT_933110 [Pavlovales sp. CCMP2436]|nr:hypothetical protein T492DRAFT_933110 [Pavlovales sp. CCMP2436]